MAPFGIGSSDPAEDRADMDSALDSWKKYCKELEDILKLLLEEGQFFHSAIEFDIHKGIGGEEFEKRIRAALKK